MVVEFQYGLSKNGYTTIPMEGKMPKQEIIVDTLGCSTWHHILQEHCLEMVAVCVYHMKNIIEYNTIFRLMIVQLQPQHTHNQLISIH